MRQPLEFSAFRGLRRYTPGSLRTRLVVIVIGIDCIAALLTGSVIVWKARTAKNLEIASAMQLAQTLVGDTIRLMQNAPAPIVLQSIDLHFQSVRHVRIAVADGAGKPIGTPVSQDSPANFSADVPPAWFGWLVGESVETKDFPIIVRGRKIGDVTITSAPIDEIGEAWNYAHTLLITAFCLNVAVIAVLFLAFGRVLAPLTALGGALKDLEGKNYSVRLPQPSIAELATITDPFNKAAEALSEAQDANRQLNRRLLAAQDDERRRTALELHDEVGPCLFALEATATSIRTLTKANPEMSRIHERAIDLVALVEKVQGINRRVLDRLRPMALGRIPLRDSLLELLVNSDIGEQGPQLNQTIGSIRASYGLLVDLTVYRCVQEGLFNAVRHAQAEKVHLFVDETGDEESRHIVLQITDDGRGFTQTKRAGRGLAGIRERVEALAGSFDIETSPKGTSLDILIPIDPIPIDAANSLASDQKKKSYHA